MVQLSHPYMITRKTIVLIVRIFCQQSDVVKYELWLSNLLEYFLELKVTLLKTL